MPQRESDHCGVVDVRVEIVLILERPTTRSELGDADRPVALDRDFLSEQIRTGRGELRMVGRNSARTQREHGEPGVPHG